MSAGKKFSSSIMYWEGKVEIHLKEADVITAEHV
jgi:hypothetical protein